MNAFINDYKNKLDKFKESSDLTELFKLWYEAQKEFVKNLEKIELDEKGKEIKKRFDDYFNGTEEDYKKLEKIGKCGEEEREFRKKLEIRKWFFPDGIIEEKDGTKYARQSKRVLYLLKETTALGQIRTRRDKDNEEDQKRKDYVLKNRDRFWNYKDFDFGLKRDILSTDKEFYTNIGIKYDDLQGDNNSFVRRIYQMQYYLTEGKSIDIKKEYKFDNAKNYLLKNPVAYMNLNKMGGGGLGDKFGIWPVYAQIFSDFIKKEIEILSPNIIVCCGTFNVVKELFKEENSQWYDFCGKIKNPNCIVYNMIHPSIPTLKPKKYHDDYQSIFIGRVETINKNKQCIKE